MVLAISAPEISSKPEERTAPRTRKVGSVNRGDGRWAFIVESLPRVTSCVKLIQIVTLRVPILDAEPHVEAKVLSALTFECIFRSLRLCLHSGLRQYGGRLGRRFIPGTEVPGFYLEALCASSGSGT